MPRYTVRDKATGREVDHVELDDSSIGPELSGDMASIASILMAQLAKKYPPSRYEILEETRGTAAWAPEVPPAPEPVRSSEIDRFRMEGSASALLLVNIGGLVFGSVLLYFLLLVRLLFHPALLALGIVGLIFYLTAGFLIWLRRGIRVVEVAQDGISIYRGKEEKPTHIEAGQITGINIFRKLGRRVVNILTGGTATRALPGVTIFSGPRIRITDDAFKDKEFDVFLEKLRLLEKEKE